MSFLNKYKCHSRALRRRALLRRKSGNGRIIFEAGQSLVEIVIALALGAVIIGGASAAVVVVLQSGQTVQDQQVATIVTQDMLESARAFAKADWHNISNLTHGTSTTYFLNTTSSEVFAVEGTEGIIEGDIRGGLVGYWKLDEATSTNAYDYSGNGNNSAASIAVATSTSSCKIGGCYEFDGSSGNINMGDVLDQTGSFSVSVWINADDVSTPGQRIVSKDDGIDGWALSLGDPGTGQLRFFHRDLSPASTDTGNVISANTWYHVAAVWDGSNNVKKIYVNGASEAEDASVAGTLTSNSNNVRVGKADSGGDLFDGLIDDVRIYNRALSADEVEELYNSTMFSRYFYVEDVCRTNDANYDIAGTTSCGTGEVEDPSTQKVTAVVSWSTKTGTKTFSVSQFLTRWKNKVFHQSDWSGGSGQEGPVTESTDKFSSSTDIDSSNVGSIRIQGL